MEIEKKYLLTQPNFPLDSYPRLFISQSYVCHSPVIRVRKTDESYTLTVKGAGAVVREEFELPLTEAQYLGLLKKREGRSIEKERYLIPLECGHMAELDIYHGHLDGLMTVEVEFESVDEMKRFTPPEWFGRDVSEDKHYKNSSLALAETYYTP